MKKLKLLFSISSLCFAFAILCFGVYSATNVQYTISGSISYEVTDAFVKINTKVYKGSNQYNRGELEILSEDLADGTETLANNGFVQDSSISFDEFNSEASSSFEKNDLNLAFSSTVKSYVIEIDIKNLSSSVNVWALIEDVTGVNNDDSNIVQGNNVIQQSITSTASKKMYVCLSVKDMTLSITAQDYTIPLKVGVGDYALSETNLSKINLTWNSSNSCFIASPTSNASGLLVFPETYTDGTNTGSVNVSMGNVDAETPTNSSSSFTASQITTLVLPQSMTNLQVAGFCMVPTLTRAIIPTGYSSDIAFLAGTGVYSARVRTLTQYSFAYCQNLESVKFYNTVTDIGAYSFALCSNLKYLHIPATLTNLLDATYKDSLSESNINFINDFSRNGVGLEKIEVDANNPNYSSQDGVLFNKDKTQLYCYPMNKKDTAYEIPNTVTSVEWFAFYKTGYLQEVDLGTTMTTIGQFSFDDSGLKSVTIPDQVQRIESDAFAGCENLVKVIIGKNVNYIGIETFAWNNNLKYVEINSTVDLTLDNFAFRSSNSDTDTCTIVSAYQRNGIDTKTGKQVVYTLNKGTNQNMIKNNLDNVVLKIV